MAATPSHTTLSIPKLSKFTIKTLNINKIQILLWGRPNHHSYQSWTEKNIKYFRYKTCMLEVLTFLSTISLIGMSQNSARCWDVFTPASLNTPARVLITSDQMSVLLQCVRCCSMLISRPVLVPRSADNMIHSWALGPSQPL